MKQLERLATYWLIRMAVADLIALAALAAGCGGRQALARVHGPGRVVTMAYRVLRHGGRSSDSWRVAFDGDREAAERAYQRLYEAMRQGGVRLVDAEGRVLKGAWAPRLRTRW